MGNRVIIIGGGVAGMQAAITLDELGLQPILIEKEAVLGGKLNKWDRLFPTMTPAEEVLTELTKKVQASNTEVHTSTGSRWHRRRGEKRNARRRYENRRRCR